MTDHEATADVTAEDIDNILDEIEENEEKTSSTNAKSNAPTNGANWKQILTQLQNGNSSFVKTLITSKDIDVNGQNPANGMTILIYVTIIGNYDLVKLVCNFGANVHTKDHSGCDALDYAQRYGRYAITELLFYRQLSGSLGKDLKEIATSIYDKNDEAKRLKANDTVGYDGGEHSIRICNNIIKAMIKAIENRDPFSPDLLYYAWYFYLEQCDKAKQDPLTTKFPEIEEKPDNGFYGSRDEEYAAKQRRREKNDAHLLTLWKVMMTAYEEILCDTSDKNGWEWLKNGFINSLIWFLPHPKNKLKNEKDTKDSDDNDMEHILSTTLFYELLTRVRKESKVQSDLLLKEKIDKIKTETPQEWETLIAYNVSTQFSKNARQDACGCITPRYKEDELSEERYPPSTHFSAKKHYDTNIYLNELLFRANILDTMFQFDMKKITKEINSVTGFDSQYRAGPVKTLTRSQTKVENDYIEEDYPTAAKILDINRCAIQFKNIDAMMKYIQLFTERISQKEAYSIVAIIRCKNGWSTYNPQQPAYTDVKLNVLVQSPADDTIVAEIQLLLKLMSAFKRKAHKLYSVERKFELVYNFNKLQTKMSQFKDLFGNENVMIDLLKRNEVEGFKSYWLIITNEEDWTNSVKALVPEDPGNPWKVPFFYVLMVDEPKDICEYLVKNFSNVLCKALEAYLHKYYEKGYKSLLNAMYKSQEKKEGFTRDALVFKLLQKIYDFTSVNADSQSETLTKLFTMKDESKKSIVSAIGSVDSESKFCAKSFKYIIDNEAITYDDKIKIFGARTSGLLSALKHRCMDHIAQILFYFNKRKDKQRLMDVLKWQPKKDSARTGFLFLCSKAKDMRSLLPFVLHNPMLSKDELNGLMTVADDTLFTAVEVSLKGNTLNTHLVLRWFNSIDGIMKMMTSDFVKDLDWNSQCVLVLLKHIATHKAQVMHLILGKWGLFAELMKKNRVEVMKYILYESGLTPQDIMGFIDKRCIFDYPSDHPLPDANCATEIIRYFKDDKASLMKILEMVYENRSLFKMLYCKYKSNETRQILFTESALGTGALCDFLKRNEKGKGVGDHDHDFGPKKESTFFKLVQGYHGGKNTIDLVKYLSHNNNYELKNLLLQKHTETNKEYLAKLERKDTLDTIYGVFVRGRYLDILKELVQITRTAASKPDQREIAGRYEEYVKFCQDKPRRMSFGTREVLKHKLFVDIPHESHPLRTACICGDHYMMKEHFLGRWQWDKDGANLFEILNNPKLVNALFCNGNDDETNIKMLRLVILDNTFLSDAQKFDLITATTPPFEDEKKNYDIIITPAFVDTTSALREHVLAYFEEKGQKEYVLRLLQDKISWHNKRGATKLNTVCPMYAICRSKYKTPPVQFIIDCPLLSDEEKIKLLDDSFVDIVKLKLGLSLNVLQFIGDSGALLMQFLSKKDEGETVLMLMMKAGSDDAQSLFYILNHELLSYEYKRKLVFGDVYTFAANTANSSDYWGYGPYQHVFALSCKAYHDTRYIEKIFEYFDVEKDVKFDDKTSDILVKIETAQHLRVVLDGIGDNALLKRLFTAKSEDANAFGATAYQHCQHYGPKGRGFKDDTEPFEIRNRRKFEMIHKYEEYLRLDEALESSARDVHISFNEYAQYWTNPWITCCEFGKMETMIALLEYVVREDDAKLIALLTQNYNLLNGNDWMMTLFVAGYKQMIAKILQELEGLMANSKHKFVDVMRAVFMVQNRVNSKTFLMMIGETEDDVDANCSLLHAILSVVKDKKVIAQILNCKDDSGKTCVDYAKQSTKAIMQKYCK